LGEVTSTTYNLVEVEGQLTTAAASGEHAIGLNPIIVELRGQIQVVPS